MERSNRRKETIQIIALCVVMVLSVLILLTLCADEGIDYDESYSFETDRDNTDE